MRKIKKIINYCSDIYYKIYWIIKNIITYRKIIFNERPYGCYHILDMLEFQLTNMKSNISLYSYYEDKYESIKNIERCIILLSSIKEDEYLERCGYIKTDNIWHKETINREYDNYSNDDIEEIFKNATLLKQKEFDELFNILKNNLCLWTY